MGCEQMRMRVHRLQQPIHGSNTRVVRCNQSSSYGALEVLLSGETYNTADVTEMQCRFVAILIKLFILSDESRS